MDVYLKQDFQNHWLFQDGDKLKWWLDLHFLADENGVISMNITDLTYRWRVDRFKVSRFLKKLVDAHLLHIEMHLITILEPMSYKGGCTSDCTSFATPQEKSLISLPPTPPISFNPKEYNSCSFAPTHTCEENFDLMVGMLAAEEQYARRYQQEGLWAEAAMMAHLTVAQTQDVFEEFLVEQKHNSSKHSDYSDFKRHFLNYLRGKAERLRKQSNSSTNGNQRKYDDRRGTEVSSSADYFKPL